MNIGVAFVIAFELAGLAALCWAWAKHEQQIAAWERRQVRRIKRWLCAKLAEDGIWAEIRWHEVEQWNRRAKNE